MSLPTVDLTGCMDKDLHGVLRAAADSGPLACDEMTGATVILRQRDLEVLANDKRLNGIGLALFDMMGITEGPLRYWYSRLMFTTEGDYHRRIRSLVSRAFTPRSVESLRTTAAEMAIAAVSSVQQGGDLVPACSTLATRLICRLLGVPDTDVAVFAQWADALSPVFYVMTTDQIADATTAITELREYVDALTTRRVHDPGPDLITALLASEAEGERLSHDEIVNMIANLLVAGHDTAGSQIPCSLLVALQHRDQLDGIGGDEVRLASAVTETMRLEPSIPAIPRTAIAPIELHGTTIPAGAMVFLCIAAACRDASAWSDPDRFDPNRFERPDAPRLLNFGAGAHYCLGAALAKVAVESCVRSVLSEDPPLHLSESPSDIPWRRILGRSPARLIVDSCTT
ncbi:MAG: cytochrome P450 [Mycobacterium sp.]|nr:cytochrome P450 [Mycobacterium sp.]